MVVVVNLRREQVTTLGPTEVSIHLASSSNGGVCFHQNYEPSSSIETSFPTYMLYGHHCWSVISWKLGTMRLEMLEHSHEQVYNIFLRTSTNFYTLFSHSTLARNHKLHTWPKMKQTELRRIIKSSHAASWPYIWVKKMEVS